jgi:hypothetical protein
MVVRGHIAVAALMIAGLFVGVDAQQDASLPSSTVRESLDDAWWTGPILANSPATLPRGHFLIETPVLDVITAHMNGFGARAFVIYGLFDRVTVGVIPNVGYNKVNNAPSSSGVRLGDIPLLVKFRLTRFHEGKWIPGTCLQVQETLPTGKYDQLGGRLSNGLGSGAYTTTLQLNSQTYFWLPNGRILRMRFDVSQAFSKRVNVDDVSVYGTATGFRGHAKPGSFFFADPAWEYSLTRNWVLALDATYRHNWNTRVTGYNIFGSTRLEKNPSGILLNSGSSDGYGFVPAIEYNWNSNLGVILGTRVIPASHNTAASITPVVAINFLH